MNAQAQALVNELQGTQQFFNRSTECLNEDHANFRPAEGMFTTAQQVAHVAQTLDWFLEGAFRPEGFDMNFEEHIKAVLGIDSLKAARDWADKSFKTFIDKIGSLSPEELMEPLPAGPVMGGAPRLAIVGACVDHTAHHRGALTVYARLQGLTPAMPYM